MKNQVSAGSETVSFWTKACKFIKKYYAGYLFVLPVVIGICWFTLVPMVMSFVYNFFDYDVINPLTNFGLQNYIRPFKQDWGQFSTSLRVTFTYSLISIPLNMVLSFALAMFLNQKHIKGMKFFRVLYYLPVLIPAVISGFLWMQITDVQYGIANELFRALGLPEYEFYSSERTTMPTLIGTGLFGLGGGMIMWLASLRGIPEQLFEAASLEGAGFFTRTFRITIPMCTPIIFYNLIMGIINSLQMFASVFVISSAGGGPGDALLFYVVNVYNKAFGQLRMGYASALSWILFVIIALLSVIVFKTNKWVYYGEDA